MSFEVYVRPAAESDIQDVAKWYERQRNCLGEEFLDEILIVFDVLLENPEIYPLVHRNTHSAVMKRFPFGIFYRIKEEAIVVVAVMQSGGSIEHNIKN